MNCKPGDLAIIVGVAISPENNGRIVRVVRLCNPNVPFDFGNAVRRVRSDRWTSWEIESETERPLAFQWRNGEKTYGPRRPLDDRYLRPIRPQSDDAQDESTAWLPPVPVRKTEPV